jgi:type I restriction enzyme R subunit
VTQIEGEVDHYEKVREEVKLASGDYVDMKMFEPAMRHLLDTYVRAEESEKVSAFDNLSVVQMIVERGAAGVDALPKGLRENREAMAETIENNVRRLIIDEMAVNPKYYDKMSQLLDALIVQRKQEALDYKAYLTRIVELARQVSQPENQSSYPATINTATLRALYDNLDNDIAASIVREGPAPYGASAAATTSEEKALALDRAIRQVKKADWRGNRFKEREVRNAIKDLLGDGEALVERIFEIVKAQRDY